jgi:broad specificity phosphatase PhoE
MRGPEPFSAPIPSQRFVPRGTRKRGLRLHPDEKPFSFHAFLGILLFKKTGESMRLSIIRHAEPDYEHNTITRQGHQEAKALAKRLKNEGLTRIYSSPLGRALHTADYTAKATGLKVGVEKWTRELSELKMKPIPPWEPLIAWDLPGEIIRGKRNYLAPEGWHQVPYWNSKKFREVIHRVNRNSDSFTRRHGYRRDGGRYRVLEENKERIAVFCHGGFGLTWLSHLLEIPLALMWSGFWMAPSSVTTILFDMRSSRWAVPRCIGFCDVSHLRCKGLPVSSHGIKANFD